jgi:hypothetical protein
MLVRRKGGKFMPDYIGLYYPHSTFPNDALVKQAALYWDKLGRIVPPGYRYHDSDTVQRLQGELGFIKDVEPNTGDIIEVSALFENLLSNYGEQLVKHYDILSYRRENDNLGYIYSHAKMSDGLIHALLRLGLAAKRGTRDRRNRDYEQIGMHPRLALVYMEALAEQMAFVRRFHPLTDNPQDHVAMGPYTLERLAQALLDPLNAQPYLVGFSPTSDEVQGLMATIAFQSVLPHDITNVPVQKIIQLRREHNIELTALQTHIREFVAKLDTIQQINDSKALRDHLEVAYEKELKPQLEELKQCMRSIGIETASAILNVKLTVPPLLATGTLGLLLHLPPVVTGIATIAWSIFPVLQKKRFEMGKKVYESPASYLFYAQEVLTPTNAVSQIAQSTRRAFILSPRNWTGQ